MPRPRNVERTVAFTGWIPEALHARLLLQAFDPLIGKTPPRGLTAILTPALELYFDVLDGRRSVTSKEPTDVHP